MSYDRRAGDERAYQEYLRASAQRREGLTRECERGQCQYSQQGARALNTYPRAQYVLYAQYAQYPQYPPRTQYAQNTPYTQYPQYSQSSQSAQSPYPQSSQYSQSPYPQYSQYSQSPYPQQGDRGYDSRSIFEAAREREREERRREEIGREERLREEMRREEDRERERYRQQERERYYGSQSRPTYPTLENTRALPPAPYTDSDEEPQTIPITPATWNGYRSTISREELVARVVRMGATEERAREELVARVVRMGATEERARELVDEEFQDHAPLHWPGSMGTGPSRYDLVRERRRPPM